MSVRRTTVQQTDSLTWEADTTIAADVEQVGLLTRIEATVEITPSATLRGAVQPDALFKLIQNLRIEGGGHTYFTLPADDGAQGGTLLHYLNVADGFGVGHGGAAVAAPDRSFNSQTFILHPGSRPMGPDGPFDLSAFIPAGVEAQLRAEWVTSGNDVMDDTVTIASADMRLTLSRVQGSETELQREMQRQGVILPQSGGGSPVTGMVPSWRPGVVSPTATASDFSLIFDIPVGAWLKRIAFLSQDATAARTLRAADVMTDFELVVVSRNERIIRTGVERFYSQQPAATMLTPDAGHATNLTTTVRAGTDFDGHAPNGISIWDARPHATLQRSYLGRDYGLNLTGQKAGNVQLGFTITAQAAGDDILMIFERYLPYRGPLD